MNGMACEVHLGGQAPNRDTVELLIQTSPCVFVYVDNGKDTIAKVSDKLPEKYLAAVAFMGGPIGVNAASASTATAITSGESATATGELLTTTTTTTTAAKQPLQCITLQPTMVINQSS
jgi:hypothetical protein